VAPEETDTVIVEAPFCVSSTVQGSPASKYTVISGCVVNSISFTEPAADVVNLIQASGTIQFASALGMGEKSPINRARVETTEKNNFGKIRIFLFNPCEISIYNPLRK
jgi:hypothetical protein